jgi:hypothetical protein
MNDFLCKRLNGPYAQSTINGIQSSYEDTYALINYFYNLSIDTANEKELEEIGKIIGLLRPFVPSEYIIDNAFIFFGIQQSGARIFDVNHGFSSLEHPENGGRLVSVNSATIKLPLDIYRQILKKFAYIKYNGLTFTSLDYLLSISGANYEFSWNEFHDIVITIDSAVSVIFLYMYRKIFEFFATQPLILLQITTME